MKKSVLRFTGVLLALSMLICIAACGNDKEDMDAKKVSIATEVDTNEATQPGSPESDAPGLDVMQMVAATNNGFLHRETIEFGSYPQSRVVDPEILAALNAELGNEAIGNYKDVAFDSNNDGITEEYRAVRFDNYELEFTTGFDSDFSHNRDSYAQQDNGYNPGETYWFKFEPLKWVVLDKQAGLVMCQSVIDAKAFNEADSPVSFEDSSLNEWLGDKFRATAFKTEESDAIMSIGLPTFAHITNQQLGFDSDPSAKDNLRVGNSTDYAQARSCYTCTEKNKGAAEWVGADKGAAAWWLADPVENYGRADALFVTGAGRTAQQNDDYISVCCNYMGVRPVMTVGPDVFAPVNDEG